MCSIRDQDLIALLMFRWAFHWTHFQFTNPTRFSLLYELFFKVNSCNFTSSNSSALKNSVFFLHAESDQIYISTPELGCNLKKMHMSFYELENIDLFLIVVVFPPISTPTPAHSGGDNWRFLRTTGFPKKKSLNFTACESIIYQIWFNLKFKN